jgi:hypothetical protein
MMPRHVPSAVQLTCGLILTLVLTSISAAEPPTLDFLYPAGFARGTTSEKVLVAGNIDPWPVKAWVSQPGVTVEMQEEKGRLNVVVTEDVPAGVYFMRLYNDQGASAIKPFFVGTTPEKTEEESNNDAKNAKLLAGPTIVNGRLDSSADVDQFRVTASQGDVLVASLVANNFLASPMDAVLQVCDPRGLILAQNDDEQGIDPQIAFAVPADGEYLVRLFAFPETPNSTIGFASGNGFVYRLTITTQPFVDHLLPLAVNRNEPTELKLQGWNLAEGATLPQPELAEGIELLQPAASHPANAIFVKVVEIPSQLAVSDQVQAISLPLVLSGRIDKPRSSHRFLFEASKGKPVIAAIESRALGFPMDPRLQVIDGEGKVLVDVDDAGKNRDPVLTFNPPADGQYTLVVRDLHRGGGFRYVYRLTVTQPEPDYALSLAADMLTLKAGESVDLEVTVNRIQGFKEEIQLTVEGLPDGIEAAAVSSAAAGDSAKKVTVKISGSAEAWSGAIRIIGQVGERQRTASYAIAKTTLRREDPWLTVLPVAKE